MKKIAKDNDTGASHDTLDSLNKSFYVDDGLVSCKTAEDGTVCELVALLDIILVKFKNLHPNVQKYYRIIELLNDDNNHHKVSGLQWDLDADTLTQTVKLKPKSNTKPG